MTNNDTTSRLVYDRLIWERDHSDALHEWDKYNHAAELLAVGLVTAAEAKQIAGFLH